jgi:hypothetical protein
MTNGTGNDDAYTSVTTVSRAQQKGSTFESAVDDEDDDECEDGQG